MQVRLLEVGPHQLGVLQHRIGEVGPQGHHARHARALQVRPGQDRPLGLAGPLGRLEELEALHLVHGRDQAFAQVGLEQVGVGEIGAPEAGAPQVGALHAGAGEVGVLKVGAEQVGVVQARLHQLRPGQDGPGEVGVGEVSAGEVQARQVHPGKDRARAAGLGGPQPLMPGADQVGLYLCQPPRDGRCTLCRHDQNLNPGRPRLARYD